MSCIPVAPGERMFLTVGVWPLLLCLPIMLMLLLLLLFSFNGQFQEVAKNVSRNVGFVVDTKNMILF